jgi:hypothetical protein
LYTPPRIGPPATMRDVERIGNRSAHGPGDLGDRRLRSVIHGWSDANPAAAPSRALVMELSALVAGAQARS